MKIENTDQPSLLFLITPEREGIVKIRLPSQVSIFIQ